SAESGSGPSAERPASRCGNGRSDCRWKSVVLRTDLSRLEDRGALLREWSGSDRGESQSPCAASALSTGRDQGSAVLGTNQPAQLKGVRDPDPSLRERT